MSEQDRYIQGVPCWVDTAHPDPDAAAAFYGELFGWQLEDVMPPDAPGSYYTARLDGGDVAAISSPMSPAPRHVEHLHLGRRRRRDRRACARRRRHAC